VACLIASRVAAALHHAHELTDTEGNRLHVVHRDVSPHNIRISYEGAVKVLDFGIAKARTNEDTTETGEIKGKYGYLSPEQVAHRPLDPRSDVFALGIVLHEMLTGERLFKGATTEILRRIESCQIAPPSEVAGHALPPALDGIVMAALAREPERRFPTARAMQEELEGFLRQYPATDADLRRIMVSLFGRAISRKSQFLEMLKQRVSGEYRAIDFAQLEATKETFIAVDQDGVETQSMAPQPGPPTQPAPRPTALQPTAHPAHTHANFSEAPPPGEPERRLPLSFYGVSAIVAIAISVATYAFWSQNKQPLLQPDVAIRDVPRAPDSRIPDAAPPDDQARPDVQVVRQRLKTKSPRRARRASRRVDNKTETLPTADKRPEKKKPKKPYNTGDWIIRPKIE
jgi:serine/threonine protein kinase